MNSYITASNGPLSVNKPIQYYETSYYTGASRIAVLEVMIQSLMAEYEQLVEEEFKVEFFEDTKYSLMNSMTADVKRTTRIYAVLPDSILNERYRTRCDSRSVLTDSKFKPLCCRKLRGHDGQHTVFNAGKLMMWDD